MINPHLSFAHGEAYRTELRRQAERYRRARRRDALGARLWRLVARRHPAAAPAAPIPLTGEGHGQVEAPRAA